MKHYRVFQTIQSRHEGSKPTDVTYYTGTDPLSAGAALLVALNSHDNTDSPIPEAFRFDVLSVRCDVTQVEPEPEPEPDPCPTEGCEFGVEHGSACVVDGVSYEDEFGSEF